MNFIRKLSNIKSIRFLIVGVSTVILDLLIYYYLISAGLAPLMSKGLSFLAGSIYAYQLNRTWTFSAEKPSIRQVSSFLLAYCFSLLLNVSSNSFFLLILTLRKDLRIFSAFVLATLISATSNYLILKNIVFNRRAFKRSTTKNYD